MTAYYKWRLWMRNGLIYDTDILLNEEGKDGKNANYPDFHTAVKKVKINPGVFKSKGQQ